MSKKVKREYTDDELIRRVTDIEEIKKVANKRVYYMINEWRDQELKDLWVSDPANQATASFGKNTGYYVGMEAIRGYYVDHHAREMGDGTGYLSNHPVTTGLVRLAEDGKTAKGMWYVYGSTTEVYSTGPKAAWNFGRCAVDFVKEDGVWKIWHMTMFTDIQCPVGGNWGKDKMYPHEGVEIPEPTVKEHYYTGYGEDFLSLVEPPLPEPYDTWSDEISYGPEGYPEKTEYHFGAGEGGNY